MRFLAPSRKAGAFNRVRAIRQGMFRNYDLGPYYSHLLILGANVSMSR